MAIFHSQTKTNINNNYYLFYSFHDKQKRNCILFVMPIYTNLLLQIFGYKVSNSIFSYFLIHCSLLNDDPIIERLRLILVRKKILRVRLFILFLSLIEK